MSHLRCINCDIRLTRIRRHLLSDESEPLKNVIRLWIYPREVSSTDYICHTCFNLGNAQVTVRVQNDVPNPERRVGHRNICVGCGRSILRLSSRTVLRENRPIQEQQIVDIISQWIHPRELTTIDQACLACWLRAQRVLNRQQAVDRARIINVESLESTSQSVQVDNASQPNPEPGDDHEAPITLQPESHQGSITLSCIRRAAATPRPCVFPNCGNVERHRIPDFVRSTVVKDFNYYIPHSARICTYHSGANMFHDLYTSTNSHDTFSGEQIEDLIFILTENIRGNSFNFEDINSIPDHLLHYWTGLTKQQHNQILYESNLNNVRRGGFALTALLCKLRTGDSGDRLSALFQIPRRTIETLMDIARQYLCMFFVPRHLGLQHIDRGQLVLKNSTIANHLFGSPDTPSEEHHLITICDGTYIYTQKSSNYLFQKSTYSVHKYRNLVKPFMIVCCDGYILDVLGPFSATTNDATIMSSWIEEAAVLEFFREGDVFLLDRGFRDCIYKVQDKGFDAHMPETLSPGHSQLTTLEGNRSRCVTINRWVVEAVNGRVKRDFKIFRQEYFNRAGAHLMRNLKIAAALLNAFATPFTDSIHAEEIVQIINDRLFLTNKLADIVIAQNLIRRNSYFTSITTANISFPRLTMEDLVLFACGTYQIRQARSYIGEHIKFHGVYDTQICTENAVDLSSLDGEAPILIKGKIKSRHISRKIYFVFIALDRTQEGRNAIIGYCCNCIVGLRTVGCCSHVMSIIWYLSYAYHLDNLSPPAQILDRILVRLD